MKASASSHEFTLLTYDIVSNRFNDTALVGILGREDAVSLASIAEHGDTFASTFPRSHVDINDLLFGEILWEIDCG